MSRQRGNMYNAALVNQIRSEENWAVKASPTGSRSGSCTPQMHSMTPPVVVASHGPRDLPPLPKGRRASSPAAWKQQQQAPLKQRLGSGRSSRGSSRSGSTNHVVGVVRSLGSSRPSSGHSQGSASGPYDARSVDTTEAVVMEPQAAGVVDNQTAPAQNDSQQPSRSSSRPPSSRLSIDSKDQITSLVRGFEKLASVDNIDQQLRTLKNLQRENQPTVLSQEYDDAEWTSKMIERRQRLSEMEEMVCEERRARMHLRGQIDQITRLADLLACRRRQAVL